MFSFQFVVMEPGAGDFMSWPIREAMIIEEINRWKPDLVCVQELDMDVRLDFEAKLPEYKVSTFRRRTASSKDCLVTLYNADKLALRNQLDFTLTPDPHGGMNKFGGSSQKVGAVVRVFLWVSGFLFRKSWGSLMRTLVVIK